MTTKEIANQLVALCRAGKNLEAVNTLMSADVVSVEAMGNETMPAVMTGAAAVRGKGEWWIANHTVHSASAKGPYPNGDRFAVIFDYTITPKMGPMAGKRMRMEEVAMYTVTAGKISREEFFYDMSGGGDAPVAKPKKKAAKKKAAPKATPKVKAKVKKAAPKAKAKAKAKAKTRRR